jgi:hypothetical protein
MEISEKEFYFLYGYNLAEEYFSNPQIDKQSLKDEIEFYSLEHAWSESDPYMLTNYLPEHNIPERFYDDFVRGISVSMDKNLLHSYLEQRGAK